MEIAVVILNWNGKKMLERYLPSVISTVAAFNSNDEERHASLIVADNASSDGSLEYLAQRWPDLRTIRLDENYGFAEGYNRALEQIEADYFILLNSDIHTPDGWLEPLIDFMESHPDAGICQPKVLSDAERNRFEYAGACGGFIDRFGFPFCRGRILSNTEIDEGQYDEEMEVFWATGACMVIRPALFRHLGGFDPSFFAHMEEIDLCWRAKLLGYQVWCVPSSRIHHLGGGTLPNNSPRKLFFNYRNNLLMLAKNLPESIRGKRVCLRLLIDDLSALAYLFTFKWSFFHAVMKAHRAYFRMRRNIEPSPFIMEYNNAGYYRGRIVLQFFLSGRKLTFDKLKFR